MADSIAVLDVGGTSIKVGALKVPSGPGTNGTSGRDVLIADSIPTLARPTCPSCSYATPRGSGDEFETFGTRLGRFLDTVTKQLDVDLVVIGGGVAGSFERFAPAARREMAIPCVAATLSTAGPHLGAARLAFH